ncbi:hypothetical protein EDD18DRAFT_1366702 [Armillaria luteobubalina]|uniref:Uncharacterized protein n=1 Tax=Armillaria luteobubalina TaxID=153913 RepID=A0AA39P1S0_9AGAR|nr:hypothetical protein EDD18DRAFT_1366702 [Armillaria luteobubalina]
MLGILVSQKLAISEIFYFVADRYLLGARLGFCFNVSDSFAHTKQTYWIWIAIITAMRPFRALKPPHLIFLSSDDRSDNTEDADADIQSFFDGCVSTGPDISTFYSSAATEMSNSLNYLYKSVLTQPVPSSPYTVLGEKTPYLYHMSTSLPPPKVEHVRP